MLNDNTYIELRKQRDFSEVISTGFQFIRVNWKTLYRPLVFICLPVYLVASLLFTSFFRTVMTGARSGDPSQMFSHMGSLFLGYILMGFAALLMYAMVFEYMRFYVQNKGLAPTTGELWRQTSKQLLSYLGLGILCGLMVMLGFFLLVIPGIYMAIALSLAFPLLAFERASIGDCISRAFKLISGNWWTTFGLLIVLAVLITLVSYIIYLPIMAITGFSTLSGMNGMENPAEMGERMGWMMTIFMIGATALNVLLQPFLQIPLGIHTLSLIEQKEAPGLHRSVDEISFNPKP